MATTLKFPLLAFVAKAELSAVVRDVYHDQCIEKKVIPEETAFLEDVVVHVTNMVVGEGETVHWVEDSDSENLHICFTCVKTRALVKVVQPFAYVQPMNVVCVRLCIEHMLIHMLELLLFTKMQDQITEMSNAAKERRNEIVKYINKKKEELNETV